MDEVIWKYGGMELNSGVHDPYKYFSPTTDPRSKDAEKRFREALVRMSRHTNFGVTVSGLCCEVGVRRDTFYTTNLVFTGS